METNLWCFYHLTGCSCCQGWEYFIFSIGKKRHRNLKAIEEHVTVHC